jgi:hypothetical protein
MKTPERSRFGKLVAYLLDPQGKKTRVEEVTITNCVSTDTTWAVRESAATQAAEHARQIRPALSFADFAQSREKTRCPNAPRDRGTFLQGAWLRRTSAGERRPPRHG